MGVTKTNNFSLAYAIQTAYGTLGSTLWKLLEPNDISTFGAEITKVARSPISKRRARRKGTVVDLDSSVEFDHDMTLEVYRDFVEGFTFARATGLTGAGPIEMFSGSGYNTLAAGSGTITHTTITAAIPAGRLIINRAWSIAGNNGLKVVGASGTATTTNVTGMVAETPTQAQHASTMVCGHRAAVAGDVQLNASGNLISTTLDFTTLGLTVGQWLKIGGSASGNQFATTAYNGTARVIGIAANLITLDRRSWTVASADTGSGKNIDLYFGRFIRNVAVDHADFIERYFTFEGAYPNLQNPSGDAYEYPADNLANEFTFNLPLTDKSTITCAFVGSNTPVPTTTRATGASTPVNPVQTSALNTSADIVRLRVAQLDETALTSYFKSASVTINNGVTPEKVLGTLGAAFMNLGNFLVDFETQVLFTDLRIPTAIRNNETLSAEWLVKNDDGALLVDLPAFTLAGGDKEFTVNETIKLNATGEAFDDPTYGYTIGSTLFPYWPA